MEYHRRSRQMLSLRYLLCFIILLCPETCFHVPPPPPLSLSQSRVSVVTVSSLLSPSSTYMVQQCFSQQESLTAHRIKDFKEETF